MCLQGGKQLQLFFKSMNPNKLCFYLHVVWEELMITIQNIKSGSIYRGTGDKSA